MNGYFALGGVLLFSLLGNIIGLDSYVRLKSEVAVKTVSEAAAIAQAKTCSAGTDQLRREADARQQEVLKAIADGRDAVRKLQAASSKALSAKPDNPSDLCGSLTRLFKSQIASEKVVR